MRLAVESDPTTLDPAIMWSENEGMLACLMFNSLLDSDADGNLVPMLAESLPAVSSDGLTYTFHLRPGVHFSNGRELVAEDVVFTLERYFDPQSGASSSGCFNSIRGSAGFGEARQKEAAAPAEAPQRAAGRWIEPKTIVGLQSLDRRTFQIQLEHPDLALVHYLASPIASVIPREEVERSDKRFGVHPAGSGPFVLKEWARGVRLRFERNPRYFLVGQPYMDAVEVLVNVDLTTQAMMMERGEIDLQILIPDPDLLRFRKDPARQRLVECNRGGGPIYVCLNCELPPFDNRLVRQALNHAVNKGAIIKRLLNRAIPARGALPMNVTGFNPNLPEYAYDPAKAKLLLAQAGYDNGFESTLWVARDTPADLQVALSVQGDLRAVGVTVQLKEVSYPTLTDAIQRRRNVPMAVFDWMATINDPKDTLDYLLNGDRICDVACPNSAFYSNAAVQQLFQIAAVEPNAARRIGLYQQIEEKLVQDAPWIFVCHKHIEVIRQPWLKGFRLRRTWPSARLGAAWLESL